MISLFPFNYGRVPEFEVSKYLISNREFYEFVMDGGYQRKELWTEEGKARLATVPWAIIHVYTL